jgi:hypothetical protein
MGAAITPESSWDAARFPNLETVIGRRLWDTPTSPGNRQNGTFGEWGGSGNRLRNGGDSTLATAHVNPNWVEWLMGWPIGWTDLRPLATDRFQVWWNSHGGRSHEDRNQD